MEKYINQFKSNILYFSDKEIRKTIQLCIEANLVPQGQDLVEYMVEAVADSCDASDNPSKEVSLYFCVFYNMYIIAKKEIKEKTNVDLYLNFAYSYSFVCIPESEMEILKALKDYNMQATDFKNEATKYWVKNFLINLNKNKK